MGHLRALDDIHPNSIRPLRGMVWVRIDDRDETSPSGLVVLAHVARPLPNVGRVVRIGAEVTCVKPGDRVRFDKGAHALRECVFFTEDDGREGRYLLLKAEHIDMVITGGTLVEGTEA